MVPLSAVVTREEKKVVYKVADNKAVEVPIKTGREFGSYVEIVSGVEDGDQVIDNPIKEIVDGVSVKVK
jgi:multidrug efflux pump subunit AcrA (membrane-fusion protein)